MPETENTSPSPSATPAPEPFPYMLEMTFTGELSTWARPVTGAQRAHWTATLSDTLFYLDRDFSDLASFRFVTIGS